MKTISSDNLLAMDGFEAEYPVKIELAYARPDNLLFGEVIYRPDARLWLHRDLAKVVLEAALQCYEHHGYRFVLYDGLRTVDAQQRMLETKVVKDNPNWLQEPRLLSPPGTGGHPRGMAIDLGLEDENENSLDMGTPFDFLGADSSPLRNPAHRQHPKLSKEVVRNRNILTHAMIEAAEKLSMPLLPLPQEWWDFRLPRSVYEQYAPLSDADLPPEMRMVRA